jgi:four helix bundle protein
MSRFIQIAMGSGAELSYHLLLSRDMGFLSQEDFSSLAGELDEILRMLSALSVRLKSSSQSGILRLKAKS